MERDPEVARRLTAKRWLAFAVGLVGFCVIYPWCRGEDLLGPALISVVWLCYASPFVAVAAGYGIAVLTGDRVGKVIFIALCLALFLDMCLLVAAMR